MIRFLFKFTICLVLALAMGCVLLALRSGDGLYTTYEWLSPARFHQFDQLITEIATAHQLDPMLVKAVVWRESKFDPKKVGSAGERGLMQVTERAAREWSRQAQRPGFSPEQLLDPRTNLEAGCWYLRRAFQHWEHQSAPTAFALAEYNAGPSRAQRWASNDLTAQISENDFRNRIDFPGTRNYVATVMERFNFYRARGSL